MQCLFSCVCTSKFPRGKQKGLKLDTGVPSKNFMEFCCTWNAMDTVTEAVPTPAWNAQQAACAFLSCLLIFPVRGFINPLSLIKVTLWSSFFLPPTVFSRQLLFMKGHQRPHKLRSYLIVPCFYKTYW
jgi:hypothetical protein